MAHAYTPGLKVTERGWARKERRLPLPGQVHVELGQAVRALEVVASTQLPGAVTMVNVAAEMNVGPEEVPKWMVKQPGEVVTAGEMIAEARAFFGLMHSICRSPVDGVIEAVSPVTGQVAIRGAPTPVELTAYIDGTVTQVYPGEGVVVETPCAMVQGIFGFGGEAYGPLRIAVDSQHDVLDADAVDENCRGAVVVGGALVTLAAVRRAIEVGAAAVVVGGMEDTDVDALLGYPIGVAITGHERVGITVVLTEGFGRIPMADRTFGILAARNGRPASVNGATQIRAGVVRPEVVIAEPTGAQVEGTPREGRLEAGRAVRLIRDPYFGAIATVVELPAEPTQIETEARVRVVRVLLGDGREVVVPRANVELIEE
ncbi:MAG: hypothetical protein N2512_05730 [Armatimonadetes bacterium]|nr:hypothetical protein [Armatimonadota bacterium]